MIEINHRLLKLFITEPNLNQLSDLITSEFGTSGTEAYYTIKDLLLKGIIEVVSFDVDGSIRTQYYALVKEGWIKPDYVPPHKALSFLPP